MYLRKKIFSVLSCLFLTNIYTIKNVFKKNKKCSQFIQNSSRIKPISFLILKEMISDTIMNPPFRKGMAGVFYIDAPPSLKEERQYIMEGSNDKI